MTSALIGLISVGLSFAGFGIEANPNAPTGAEIVRFAPKKSDFMAYIDVESIAPKNYAALKAFAASKELSAAPELQRELKSLVGQIEMGLGMAKGAVGVDPIRDLKSIAAWVWFPRTGDPWFLLHVRGNFPAGLIDKIAATSGGVKTVKLRGRTAILEDGMMLASAPDGSLLFGHPKLVRPRALRPIRKGSPRRGTVNARALKVFDQRPFFALVSSPSRMALQRMQREMSAMRENAFSDLISGHSFAAVALKHNGVMWTIATKANKGIERARMASQGLLNLMRASHFAGRGLSNIFFASLDSYRGRDRNLDTIIGMKRDLMKLVEDFTGDGKFKERIDVNRRARTVTVTAIGRSLSDVLPLAGALPAGAAAFLLFSAGAPKSMSSSTKARAVPAPRKARPRRKLPAKGKR